MASCSVDTVWSRKNVASGKMIMVANRVMIVFFMFNVLVGNHVHFKLFNKKAKRLNKKNFEAFNTH